MKRLFTFFLVVVSPSVVFAQAVAESAKDSIAVSDSLALDELVVKSSRIDNKADALRLFPTKEQKDASNTGYGLLARLALPYVTVDEVAKTITVPSNLGLVQVRINDVLADRNDLVSLDMKSVRYVDFISNPGLRYGEDVRFVINIVVARPDIGYSVGTELSQTLTAMRSSADVFARFNKGKSQFGVDYSFGYTDQKGRKYEETADYLMPDNSVYTVRRADIDARNKQLSHGVQLRYGLADSVRYALQVKLDGGISRVPKDDRRRQTVSADAVETFEISSADDTKSASMDVYFLCNLSKRQTLTANLVGSITDSDYSYAYMSAQPYSYTSSGVSRGLFGEVVYENRLRPFTLSAGVRFDLQHTRNGYEGDTETSNVIDDSNAYFFTQAKGQLGKFSYILGLAAANRNYSQGGQSNSFFTLCPEMQLSFAPTNPLMFNYMLKISQKPPRLQYLGNVTVRNNEMELTVGNPALQANHVIEQMLTASLQLPRLFSMFSAYYRVNPNCSMVQTERIVDGDGVNFVTTRTNQRRISVFYVDNYTRFDILPNSLSLSASGVFFRCFNYGDTYKHHHSAFNFATRADLFLGNFSFSASLDNGWSFLEGETKVDNILLGSLTAAYRVGRLGVSLYWQNCFKNHYTAHKAEQLNRFVHKTMRLRSDEMANMVTLTLSWRLSKGREREAVRRDDGKRAVNGSSVVKPM